MAKYRRRCDILADIVRVAGSGARKTKIMYFANLSYVLLTRYLEDALGAGFLRFNGGQYEVTRKGEIFLGKYKEFSGRYSRMQADLALLRAEADLLERMCPRRRRSNRNCRRIKLEALH